MMSAAPRICVLSKIPNLLKELSSLLPNYTFVETKGVEPETIRTSEILVTDFDLLGPILYDIPNIKWAQGTWAGVEALLPYIRHDRALHFPIIRYSGRHFGQLISEYVVTSIVNQERDFYRVQCNQTEKLWSREGKISGYRTINELNIGIMGMGNIGSRLGQALAIFGARVSTYGRRDSIDKNELSYITDYYNKKSIAQFLRGCDYIVNTLPNTGETKGLLNGSILKQCKERKPIFINVGRGSIISNEELIMAIENEWIGGAHLDVFNTEPLPAESCLWSTSNVRISPHVAAVSRAKDIAEQFAENLANFQANEKCPTIFNVVKGY